MKGWRSMVAVGLVAGVMLATGPVRAEEASDPSLVGSDTSSVPSETSPVAGDSDTWSTVGWGVLTVLANVVYVPAKLVYAGLGGLTGGMALGLTGGDTKTAESVWEPSIFGNYFLTPSMVQGEEPFSFAGAPMAAPPKENVEPPAPDPYAPPPPRRGPGYDS
jgi:hypothetical protein